MAGTYRQQSQFDMVDSVESLQSRPCGFCPVHTGNKVERSFDIRATKINHFWQSRPSWTCSTLATTSTARRSTQSNEPATIDFDKPATNQKVNFVANLLPICHICRRFVDFVASVYRAQGVLNWTQFTLNSRKYSESPNIYNKTIIQIN